MKRAVIRASLLIVLMAGVYAVAAQQAQKAATEKPQKIADGVWFEQHNDIGKLGSNVSWIEFSDYVAVVDTAFPLGAEGAIRNIKYKKDAPRGGKMTAVDPNSPGVQQLKSAAMPLIFSFSEEQKNEVRQLARLMGLEQVASSF